MFRFQFATLLTYRRNRRDMCRQMLARALAGELALLEQRTELERERTALLEELRGLAAEGEVDVDRSSSRRFHAGQLLIAARQVEQQKQLAGQQVEICRHALLRADQDVKALEKLAEKKRADFEREEERRSSREREDAWQARRALEGQA